MDNRKFTIAIIFGIIFVNVSTMAWNIPASPHLKWKVGDSWTVRTWYAIAANYKDKEEGHKYIRKGKPLDVHFEIERIISTKDFNVTYTPTDLEERIKEKYKSLPQEGYKCYEISVIFPEEETGFQTRYLLYYREDTGNLIRVQNVSKRTDGSIVNTKVDYPIDPNAPIIERHNDCLIPFDWPNWQKINVMVKHKKQKRIILQEIKEKTFTDKDNKTFEGTEVNMVLKKVENSQEKDFVRNVQKWDPKFPWWTEAIRYNEKGEIIAEAELVLKK
jgi:hypothetical protein